MSVNKSILIGRLGGNPEIRYTAGGTPVANFSVATTERWTDRDGQKQERTDWHKIVAWAKLAEICGEHLSKGRQVYVEGRMQTRNWEDRDGNKRYTTEVIAQSIRFLDSKSKAPQPQGAEPTPPPMDLFDEDVPF